MSNLLTRRLENVSRKAEKPSEEQDRVSYGTITRVNQQNATVKVRIISDNKNENLQINEYLPLVHDRMFIAMHFGPLRTGLPVRIFWRGTDIRTAKSLRVEIIGTEDYSPEQQEIDDGSVEVANYKIFLGGSLE